jgi:hypothetical protein
MPLTIGIAKLKTSAAIGSLGIGKSLMIRVFDGFQILLIFYILCKQVQAQ